MPDHTKIQDSFAWGTISKGTLLPSSEIYYEGVASAVNFVIGADKKLTYRPGTTQLSDFSTILPIPSQKVQSIWAQIGGEGYLVYWYERQGDADWVIATCKDDGSSPQYFIVPPPTISAGSDVTILDLGNSFLVMCEDGHYTFKIGDTSLTEVPYILQTDASGTQPPYPVTPNLPLKTLGITLTESAFDSTSGVPVYYTVENVASFSETWDGGLYLLGFSDTNTGAPTYRYVGESPGSIGDILYMPVANGGINGLPSFAPLLMLSTSYGYCQYPLANFSGGTPITYKYGTTSSIIFYRSVFKATDTFIFPSRAIQWRDRVFMYYLLTRPNDIYATVLGYFNNFGTLVISDATDGIIDTSIRPHPVLRLAADRQLELFTMSQQQTTVQNADGTTATNFYLKNQTQISFYDLPPVMLGESTFFIAGDKQSVYRFVETGGVESSFIGIPVSQHVKNYLNEPIKMIGVVNGITNAQHLIIVNAGTVFATTCSVMTFISETESTAASYGWVSWTFPFDIVDITTDGLSIWFLVVHIPLSLVLYKMDISNSRCFSDGTVSLIIGESQPPSWMSSASQPIVAYRLDPNDNPFQYGVNVTPPLVTFIPSDGAPANVGVGYTGSIELLPVNESEDTFFEFKKAQHFYVGFYNTFQLNVNGVEIPFYEFDPLINSELPVEYKTDFYTVEVARPVGYNVSATLLHTAPFSCTITSVGTIVSYLGS